MEKKLKQSSRKGIVSLLLVLVMILTTIVPVWAEEIPTPDISQWAIGELNEGERYGIYPIEWYYDGFRTEISQERLEELLANTASKIEALDLTKKTDFEAVSHEATSTRGEVVKRLYNILAQYELPVGESSVEYMQERGILVGTHNGLDLDKPCTTEQAVILATRLVLDTYNQLQAGSKGLAWKVEHNGNTVYFLGSIHVGSSEVYPLNQRLKQAFNESDALIVEANLFDQQGGMEYFLGKATYQDGTTLKDHISEETYEKLVEVFKKYGLPEDVYNQFKPWSIANDLTVISMTNSDNLQQGAQSANLGIDMYFLSNALLFQKPIIELEGIRYQADLFDGLSAETQEEYLRSIIDSVLEPKTDETVDSAKLLEEWLALWINGDIEGFTASYGHSTKEAEEYEFTNMLFGKRDKDMAEKIITMLESENKGTYFVVVGAGHLTQDGTVLDQLIEKGYKVEVLQ